MKTRTSTQHASNVSRQRKMDRIMQTIISSSHYKCHNEFYSLSIAKLFSYTLRIERSKPGQSEILNQLIKLHPHLAKQQDDKNNLPIHILLWYFFVNSRHDIIFNTIDVYPDSQARLPLHLAISSWCPNSILKRIIDLYSEGLLHPDSNRWFPFHSLVGRRFTGHNRKNFWSPILYNHILV
jgi:hypothetical protein